MKPTKLAIVAFAGLSGLAFMPDDAWAQRFGGGRGGGARVGGARVGGVARAGAVRSHVGVAGRYGGYRYSRYGYGYGRYGYRPGVAVGAVAGAAAAASGYGYSYPYDYSYGYPTTYSGYGYGYPATYSNYGYSQGYTQYDCNYDYGYGYGSGCPATYGSSYPLLGAGYYGGGYYGGGGYWGGGRWGYRPGGGRPDIGRPGFRPRPTPYAGGFGRAGVTRAGFAGGGFAGRGGLGGGGFGGRGGFGGGGGRRSDARVKDHIGFIGYLDNGIGFYSFTYKGETQPYVGVMAQEVLSVRPDAVSRGQDGFLRVSYDRLGLAFQTYDQWLASGAHIPATIPTMQKSDH